MNAKTAPESKETHAVAAQRLVASLHDLRVGPLVLSEIVALRAGAVPALEAFLRGPSQSLYHSRALAAEALTAIGDDQSMAALVRALRDSVARNPEPLALEAESVLISRIAECLSKSRRPEVIDALLVIMKRPAPDLQHRGLRCESGETAAQSRIQMGAGDEKRTIYRLGCPCGDDCGGGSGGRW